MEATKARRRPDFRDSCRPSPVHVETFKYSALRRDKDSTRLVRIEAADDDADPICCTVVDVAFGDRPKYQALSYTWGDETHKLKILLDGAEFGVTQNLFDALQFLRRGPGLGPFWIDAISINQADVSERNWQLQMMPHIYFRASVVLVWLGKKYVKYEPIGVKEYVEMWDLALASAPASAPAANPRNNSTVYGDGGGDGDKPLTPTSNGHPRSWEAFTEELRSDGYWFRVWIIQEIGRANRVQVCFGSRIIMEWEAFIKLVPCKSSKERFEGPLRLDELRKQRYKGGCTLRNLLENHRHALCRDPRDKVYGLIGLAVDARGFPMDYAKQEMDVWRDTMRFMNAHGLLQSPDFIGFGRMVRDLLGLGMGPVRSMTRAEPIPNTFILQAYIYGRIKYVSPSTTAIVSSLEKADEWESALQANFAKQLSDAHLESDHLMLKILGADEASLAKLCQSGIRNFRWSNGSCLEVESASKYPLLCTSAHNDRYLIQVHQEPGETTYKTGIASSQVEPGDIVCWIPCVKQAVVVRPTSRYPISDLEVENEEFFQACGAAMMTRDIDDDNKPALEKIKWDLLNFAMAVDSDTIFDLTEL